MKRLLVSWFSYLFAIDNLPLEFWNAKIMQGASESPVLQAVKLDVAAGDGGGHRPPEAEHRLVLPPIAHLFGQDHLPRSGLGVGHAHLELLDTPGCKDFDISTGTPGKCDPQIIWYLLNTIVFGIFKWTFICGKKWTSCLLTLCQSPKESYYPICPIVTTNLQKIALKQVFLTFASD